MFHEFSRRKTNKYFTRYRTKHTLFNKTKVNKAIKGAAKENINKCRRIRFRSIPSDIKNETKPKAAGAYSKHKNSNKFNTEI